MDEAARLGQSLAGRYRIERELGSGGAATVFLAEDLKHHRPVAIKVLRSDVAASLGAPRFLREIEIAARLQHPHILPLLDSGEADGLLFYVMPYVEGQSLRERLARHGELPIADTVRLLIEVVEALGYAHERGVVHRDIKPDNIMLTGRHALITDFGVARAVSEAGQGSTTTLGVALGTPTYMSPEQAAAEPNVDARSDIYAVGILAYELLVGRPPFTGMSPRQVLAAQLTQTPESITKWRDIPPALELVVMKCLAKRPADRWQSAEELLAQLEMLAPSVATPTPPGSQPVRPRRRWVRHAAVAAAAAAIVAALVYASRRPPEFILSQPIRVTVEGGLEVQPAISPDGRQVAYAAGNSRSLRIFVRDLAGGRPRPLTDDTAATQQHPRWSPADSATILFLSRGGVYVAPAGGGLARAVVAAREGAAVSTAAWSPDGTEIAYVRADSIIVQPLAGGTSRYVGRGPVRSCTWSPAGSHIACVRGNPGYAMAGGNFGSLAPSTLVLYPAEGGEPSAVTDSISLNQSPVWSADSRRLYYVSGRDGTSDVYAIDVTRGGIVDGGPYRVTAGLNAHSVAFSADGRRLAYAAYEGTSNVWSLPIPSDPPVSANTARQVTRGRQIVEAMRISRDGRWLLYDSDREGNPDIYRIAIQDGLPVGVAERLTTSTAHEFLPDPSPGGREFAYSTRDASLAANVYVRALEGGAAQRVAAGVRPVWSPNGSMLAYYQPGDDVIVRRVDGVWQPVDTISPGFPLPGWTADGEGIYGVADGAIYLFDLATRTRRTLYAPQPGSDEPVPLRAVWPGGGSIYFKSQSGGRNSIWSIPAAGGTPRLLVDFDDPARQSYRADWTTDGKHFFFPIQDRQADVWVVDIDVRR